MDTSTNCPTSRLYSLGDILTFLQISPTYDIGCYSWNRQEVESSDKAKVNYPFYFTNNVSRSYRSFFLESCFYKGILSELYITTNNNSKVKSIEPLFPVSLRNKNILYICS